MKKGLPAFAFFFLILFLAVSCSGNKDTDSEKEQTNQMSEQKANLDISPDMLTSDVDMMCGMSLRTHTIADTAIYKGQLYGFCSEWCKNKFKEDPEAALVKLEKIQTQQD